LQLLDAYLGPDVLQRGIRAYLTAHANGSATTTDLIAALDAAAGRSLADTILPLLDRVDLPEVSASVRCDHAKATAHFAVSRDTAPVCIVYEAHGKRASACATVADGADVPLAVCPAWWLPDPRTLPVGMPLDDTIAVVDRGWPRLTPDERRGALGQLVLDETELQVTPKLLEYGDPVALRFAAVTLRSGAASVPPELRDAFDRWLRARVKAPDHPFSVRDRTDYARVQLAIAAEDPALVPAAQEIVSNLDTAPFSSLADAVTVAAADPVVATRLIAQLPGQPTDRKVEILKGLSRLDAIALLAGKAELLRDINPFVAEQVIVGTCPEHDEALAFAGEVDDKVLKYVEIGLQQCTARRARLEPVFRRWLGRREPHR
jgi:hypothetical protein